ncbi:trans-sialidase [Trypanosoma cruzi]|nr:trans-sialidase [Trypanosoma cruzi]
MVSTTASLLERILRSVGCGGARRFACSLIDRTTQSLHCGHSVGITRCGVVRKSRSPDVDGLVVVWQLRTSRPPGLPLLLDWRSNSPTWLFWRSAGTGVPQRRGSLAAVTSTRRAVACRRRIEYVSPPSCTRRPRFSQKDDQHLSDGSL